MHAALRWWVVVAEDVFLQLLLVLHMPGVLQLDPVVYVCACGGGEVGVLSQMVDGVHIGVTSSV